MFRQVKPNIIIAGVTKAGTTSLFAYLSLHHDICPSSIKETKYFMPLRYGEELEPLEEYFKYFQRYNEEKYVLEGTPAYFYGGERIATKIFSVLEKTRILVILREPIGRLFSCYGTYKRRTELAKDCNFDIYVERCKSFLEGGRPIAKNSDRMYGALLEGFFVDYLEPWHALFGDSLKILFFDDLQKDRVLFMSQLCGWLGIDPNVYSQEDLQVENRTAYYRSALFQKTAFFMNKKLEKILRKRPSIKGWMRKTYYSINESPHKETISDETRAYLKSVYAPYNRRLSERLSSMGYVHLPAWLMG